jgi:FMN phosphatase YigB (HAD superfamily)
MIKAVLFDMDDTLLDINLPAFILAYHRGLCSILGRATRRNSIEFALPLVDAAYAIDSSKGDPSLSNAEKFGRVVSERGDVNWFLPELQDALAFFDAEITPLMNTRLVNARPEQGGVALVEAALDLGLEVALATNPTFSDPVIRTRMRWAGIEDLPFKRVSTTENSTHAKPTAAYYLDFIDRCGWKPEECLMVGNDSKRDFPVPDIGMKTLYVGRVRPARAYWRGSTLELSRELPRLVEAFA